jgi:hypothetical protein
MVAKERLASRKQAVVLVFGGCEWWWLAGRGQPPENEPSGSFSGVVGGGGRALNTKNTLKRCVVDVQGKGEGAD